MPTPLTDQEEGWLVDLKRLFEDRKPHYDSAYVAAIASGVVPPLKLVHGVVIFGRQDSSWADSTHRYPQYLLARKRFSPDEGWAVFENLVRTGVLQVLGWPVIDSGGRIQDINQYGSGDEPWACFAWSKAVARVSATNDGRVVWGPLASLDSPLFPSVVEAATSWTGLPFNPGAGPTSYLILPDLRAQFSGVELLGKGFKFKVKPGPKPPGPVVVRYHASATGALPKEGSFQLQLGKNSRSKSCKTGFLPDKLVLYLFDEGGGGPVDWRVYDSASAFRPNDVEYRLEGEDLRARIKVGENQWTEFKSKLPADDEFLESIAAFANSAGGTVIVGIDRNGRIVGFKDKKYDADHVTSAVRSNIRPTPRFEVTEVQLDRRPLMLVAVSKGAEPPYELTDRGYYVRVNATDRLASRDEVLRLAREYFSHSSP